MKNIGRTHSGDWLIEFSDYEHEAFIRAQNAVIGLTLNEHRCGADYKLSADMRQFFDVMSLFCLQKFRITELKEAVGELESIIMIEKPKLDETGE